MSFKDKQKVTVIRSAVGCLSSIGFIKFLKENDFRVVGTDITSNAVGKCYVDKFYIVPKAQEIEKTTDSYLNIVKKERAKWIIPGPEEEILALMGAKTEFENLGAEILYSSLRTLKIITEKLTAYEFFKEETKVPKTFNFENPSVYSLKTKVILKPRKGRGGSKAFVTEIKKLKWFKEILPYKEYIVQEFIEGEEFTVDVLSDLEGNLLNVIPRRRIKTNSGISTIGETVKDERLYEIVLKISRCLKFIGGNCFQFIKSTEGDYFLIDINPRFGGGSILSLKASKTFGANLINLLRGKYNLLLKSSFEFEKIRMYRSYGEIYEKNNMSGL